MKKLNDHDIPLLECENCEERLKPLCYTIEGGEQKILYQHLCNVQFTTEELKSLEKKDGR